MDKNKLEHYTGYFLQGKLSDEKENELLNWINSNEANKKLFLETQKAIGSNLLDDKEQTVRLQWHRLQNRIKESEKESRKTNLYAKITTIAAAFIFGVILTTMFFKNDWFFEPQTAQLQEIHVPNGARTNIQLPDGSDVWLNAGSTLSFPSDFDKSRNVRLIGEAYLNVKRSHKPFIITTMYGEVEVKGTSFNVKAFENENFQITLETGAVLVREKDSIKEVILKPGQQATLIKNLFVVKEVNTELYTSWKDGKIIFNKEYLPQLAKRLEYWYNVDIVLDDDPRLKMINYTGTLEMESFSEVLELLKVTAPIAYNYNQKTRVITILYNKN